MFIKHFNYIRLFLTITHTVQRAAPKRCATLLYSLVVAHIHGVIATRFSTDIALRNRVSCIIIVGFNLSQM